MQEKHAGHTPGPWWIDWDEDGKSSAIETKSKGGHLHESVAIIPHDDVTDKGMREVRANAALISAAPALYEAAKHAAMEWRLHGQLTDSCRVLEAAIALAEGRKPE